MEITYFVVSNRDNALLLGDYNFYRAQLSRRLRTLRKKLGRATPKNAKYTKKTPITAEDVRKNHEFVHLLLLTSERAWAHAMHMKSTHAEETSTKGITGSTRRHIISRLNKAAECAEELVTILTEQDGSGASEIDVLEARAYAYSLSAAEEFEKQTEGNSKSHSKEKRWLICLTEYSAARVIYNALLKNTKKDVFKEIIATVVDPSIRYAAYQSSIPRTVSIGSVAIKYFPRNEPSLVDIVEKLDPDALSETTGGQGDHHSREGSIPSTINWRGRTANIVDAAIGQALAAVNTAETHLVETLAVITIEKSVKDKATAYDEVLIASQDAVDATRRAIDELEREGVDEGDARMQDLRVTSLAVNYDLVGWRIGRNRCLISNNDGAKFETQKPKGKRPLKNKTESIIHEEPIGKQLARLRERVALYDAILQSIDSVKELRGAVRDTAFMDELEAKHSYFRALKCLNVAHSHVLLSNSKNALALLVRAQELSAVAKKSGSPTSQSSGAPPKLEIDPSQIESLYQYLGKLIAQYRGLVTLQQLSEKSIASAHKPMNKTAPLVDNMNDYPIHGVDLSNLVTYPPKLEPIPIKPLFFDAAWNYIEYPGRAVRPTEPEVVHQEESKEPLEEKRPARKGWFGFGR